MVGLCKTCAIVVRVDSYLALLEQSPKNCQGTEYCVSHGSRPGQIRLASCFPMPPLQTLCLLHRFARVRRTKRDKRAKEKTLSLLHLIQWRRHRRARCVHPSHIPLSCLLQNLSQQIPVRFLHRLGHKRHDQRVGLHQQRLMKLILPILLRPGRIRRCPWRRYTRRIIPLPHCIIRPSRNPRRSIRATPHPPCSKAGKRPGK